MLRDSNVPMAFLLAAVSVMLPLGQGAESRAASASEPAFLTNLLQNPDAELGDLSGWELTENHGEGWAVSGAEGGRVFRTSYAWNRRRQTVDLYAHGFQPTQLAKAPPIVVSEAFVRQYCPDYFYLKVELLDGDLNVLETWDSGVRTNTGACQWGGEAWDRLSHTFRNYSPDVRYVRWEDGGKDSEYWLGHYGVQMDNAQLWVLDDHHPAYYTNLLENSDAETGDLSGWELTENHGEGWMVSGPEGGRVFRTSYAWNRRVQWVDLWEHGFHPDAMARSPMILASGRFQRQYCPDDYYLKVELVSADGDVLSSWDSGVRRSSGACQWGGEEWDELHHAFVDYGPGVRWVRWEDGGKDSEYWLGHYGVKMDNAALVILSDNLLENGGAETGDLGGWTVTENSGEGWVVSDGWRDFIGGNQVFRTSYWWNRREQTIDLLAKGYSPEVLDMAPPIHISEHFRRQYCPDLFYLTVELLGVNQQVLHTFETGERVNGGVCAWEGTTWEVVAHILTDYGPGVRFIRWKDGGRDNEFWLGHYGVVMDGAYLAIQEEHEDAPHLPRFREQWVGLPTSGGALSCGIEGLAPCPPIDQSVCHGGGRCHIVPGSPYCYRGYKEDLGICVKAPVECCYTLWEPASGGYWSPVPGSLEARVYLWTANVDVPDHGACGPSSSPARPLIRNAAAPGPGANPPWSDLPQYLNLELMINANFFRGHPYQDSCLEPEGATVSYGQEISPVSSSHDEETQTLVFYRKSFLQNQGFVSATGGNRYAAILNQQEYQAAQSSGVIAYAVSGHELLRDRWKIAQPAGITPTIRRPRTVVGLNATGDTLVVIVVNPGDDRHGMTLEAVADELLSSQHFNITDALTLDGSGSSQLLYRPRGGDPARQSYPSDIDQMGAVPGKFYRPVPVFLGFRPGEPLY